MTSPFKRPTDAKAPTPTQPEKPASALSREARAFNTEKIVFFKMKLRPATRRALRRAARERGINMKVMLLRLAQQAGVEVHPDDLIIRGEEDDADE